MTQVQRRALLAAHLAATAAVDRVAIREVRMPAGQLAGRHLHPCPVVGVVLEGSILFQVDGKEAQVLHAGDAFFEPADVPILHFDAPDSPAAFPIIHEEDGVRRKLGVEAIVERTEYALRGRFARIATVGGLIAELAAGGAPSSR